MYREPLYQYNITEQPFTKTHFDYNSKILYNKLPEEIKLETPKKNFAILKKVPR